MCQFGFSVNNSTHIIHNIFNAKCKETMLTFAELKSLNKMKG